MPVVVRTIRNRTRRARDRLQRFGVSASVVGPSARRGAVECTVLPGTVLQVFQGTSPGHR
eukprot:3665901-Pyramimonas_sp.AAC.1